MERKWRTSVKQIKFENMWHNYLTQVAQATRVSIKNNPFIDPFTVPSAILQ